MKKRVILAVVLLAAVAAVVIWTRSHRAGASRTELTLYGNVDIREVNLGFRVPGRIAAVLHEEGDEVKPGETLARLDEEPYRREAEQARAQVASLAARLALVEAGPRTQEVAQARAVVREREVTLTNAEAIYNRMENLLENRTVSIQDRDDARAQFREAEARLGSAREQLNLLEAGSRPEDIAQAKAELDRAKAALGTAELRLRDTTLVAPENGIVLTRAQEPGAVVATGATVLTLSLRQPVWVRAFINEPDLTRVQPGMKVEVRTDAGRDHTYTGQVGYISPRAEFTPKSVETPALRTSLVYRLRLVVEDPGGTLRQGMPVTVSIPLR